MQALRSSFALMPFHGKDPINISAWQELRFNSLTSTVMIFDCSHLTKANSNKVEFNFKVRPAKIEMKCRKILKLK